MSTMIKLGVGDDAIEVEDGASVPILQHVPGRSARGTVHVVAGAPVVRWGCDGEEYVAMCRDSRLMAPVIDLAALRRERAPKVETVGGWTTYRPDWNSDRSVLLQPREPDSSWPDRFYWIHRPGNTPELQAAFDAALDAWMAKWGEVNFAPPDCEMNKLIEAARTLGYGAKR